MEFVGVEMEVSPQLAHHTLGALELLADVCAFVDALEEHVPQSDEGMQHVGAQANLALLFQA